MNEYPAISVLLIEDCQFQSAYFKQLLESAEYIDFSVSIVHSLEAAQNKLVNMIFDIVILDLNLPDSHGVETISRFIALEGNIPVIVLTSSTKFDLGIQAVKAGAQDFITKQNMDCELLTKSIMYCIERYKDKKLIDTLLKDKNFGSTDLLTGLPNRVDFQNIGAKYIRNATRQNETLALLIVNIDSFKQINDSFGHSTGDNVLRILSSRILNSVRENDIVCRTSGDEFSIILDNVKSIDYTANVAKIILASIGRHLKIENDFYNISASIGIAICPNDGTDIETLIRNADKALNYTKLNKKNDYNFYEHKMNVKTEQKLKLKNDLRRALRTNELEVYLQPQYDLYTNYIIGAEALVRWNHPTEGIITPDKFIPLAEENNLIQLIGNWVLKQTVIWHKHFCRNYGPKFKISINLSVKQLLDDSFIEKLEIMVHNHNLDVSSIVLEITESVFIHDMYHVIDILNKIKSLGFYISVDDFGTGYSSLSYIEKLPIDAIKIDRSFINNILVNKRSEGLVKSIISIADNLNLDVIAEGVETLEQAQFLSKNNCHIIQGFLISKPVPIKIFKQLTNKWNNQDILSKN